PRRGGRPAGCRAGRCRGSWGDSGGADPGVFVSDEAELALRARAIVPDVPFLVFGHSWGSMIMRAYLAEGSGDVAGAVLCGTPAG
ncbi:alpha/beta fold hydrolase, partial [Mycobacterium tuberculosis]|nr:alpha/beta fold hydrolase [Mycobacterium tuberculosis]